MTGLKRDIGLIGAAVIALNGIVGAGIFAMPQALTEKAGLASPYLLVVFGVLMILLALVFGELAARFDQTGGPVVYVNAAFGRTPAFFSGWLYYLARIAALAANTNAFLTYAATFAPGIDHGAQRLGMIGLIVITLTAINLLGVKGAVRTLNLVTVLKLTPLVGFMACGLWVFSEHIPAPQMPADPGTTGAITLLLLYAFIGFESATLTAGETSNTRRALPRALVVTIIAMTVLYFLIQLAYVSIMQGRAPEGAPLASAAKILVGPWGALAIAAAAMISIGGNLFGSFIVTPRLSYALAEEGSLPAWFGVVHQRFATPANSILVLALIVAALAMSSAFVWLAVMASLARMFVYLACTAALLKLRAEAPRLRRSLVQHALRALAPILAAGLCLWAIAQAKTDAWLFLAAFTAAGGIIYAAVRWARRAAA